MAEPRMEFHISVSAGFVMCEEGVETADISVVAPFPSIIHAARGLSISGLVQDMLAEAHREVASEDD